LLGILAEGGDVALVTDAGTPAVSDPGSDLVAAARAAGSPVVAVPGPSAVATALSASGLPADRYLFLGFIPRKGAERARLIARAVEEEWTVVFFEAPGRVGALLRDVAALAPSRQVVVARELTKLHEECRSGAADALIAHYEAHPPKGEIVLLVGPPAQAVADEGHADTLLLEALMTEKPSQAAARVAKATGLDRKRLYARALELKAS
jgi:16S rRNA (cytidine1402-2'-O)-methyltransferase